MFNVVTSVEVAANEAKMGIMEIDGFRRLKPTGHVHGGFREGVIDGNDLGAGISWMFEMEGEISRSAEGKCGMRTVALFEED